VTERLDPRGYVVHPIAAPQGEDGTHHYLWRFWRRLPEGGQIAIFDRSWYGRVMVERVEGFCSDADWKRAYREINQFERELVDFGAIVFKFWLHVSQAEQLRRFNERSADELKRLEADLGGLAQSRQVGCVRAGSQRHAAQNEHRHGALDDCRI